MALVNRKARNPLRSDPSRTGLLRRKFFALVRREFASLKTLVYKAISGQDMLGLRSAVMLPDGAADRAVDWFDGAITTTLTELSELGNSILSDAYKKGVGRSKSETGTVDPNFLSRTINRKRTRKTKRDTGSYVFIVNAETLPQLRSRLKVELTGLTSEAKKRVARMVFDGLTKGYSAARIAGAMVQVVDVIRDRALLIAETELVRAHAEGQLDGFEEAGVEEVTATVEFVTAGDDRVCPTCASLEGENYTVDEARGEIPVHPRCRCAWGKV